MARSGTRACKVIDDRTKSPIRIGVEATFLPGGRRLLSDGDAYLTLCDSETAMPVMSQGLKHEISPDGNTIAVMSNDGEQECFIPFWRAPSWDEIEAAESDLVGRQVWSASLAGPRLAVPASDDKGNGE